MTSPTKQIIDFDARQNALDITRSIAVQAPAGSGKTELLSLRFLKLLAACQHPEEVLAITFTKKAANEMAQRILNTLEWAQQIDPNRLNTQLDRDRYEIANSVLEQDKKESWQLQQSPNRLRIQTIDSFCNFLASKLPILSNFGGPLSINEQVDDCYHLAIRNTLKLLDADLPIASAIGKLMLHFDNDSGKLEILLTNLLKQREQWIGDIVGVASSPERAMDYLAANLLELIEESIENAQSLLEPYAAELMPLLRYATANLQEQGSDSQLLLCSNLDELPESDPSNLDTWVGLTKLFLLKSDAAFRKDVRKDVGFPPQTGSKEQKALQKEKKDAMKALLLAMTESPELLPALDYLRRLPLPYDDELSWDFLSTLTQVLPTLMAQLELAFTQKRKIDYPQVSLAALRALGTEDNPTDLALSLDYQIKHILIDEFQDTSSSQMELLRKLTSGWEERDGRTLFVVGDAMQSCYGFRNANVGLFIKLRESGLGPIPVTPIDLLANFRSDSGVVDWVNAVFSGAFPEHNDISRGAVSYSHSHAVHPKDIETAVSTRIYQFDEDGKNQAYIEEAAYIADEISRLRKQHSQRKIAILIRSRGHLKFILPALREAEIPWLANEIDRLDTLPLITDLISLTSAVCNQADRLSWLAILRAPWCGISLEDLHVVANFENNISVFESMTQLCADKQNKQLSSDGLARIRKLTSTLHGALLAKQQSRISRVIRTTFDELGGEQILRSDSERDSLERFYEILKDSEAAGGLENFAEFEAKIQRSFVSSAPVAADANPVQIMTIHKSKGLEFDHVFLPGLARTSRADDKSLLLWHQRLNQQGEDKLFLATLSATGREDNTLYNLLRFEKAEKSRLESTRLLYIGVTRAMKSVYLSATLADKDGETAKPGSGTLLATIWENLTEASVEYHPIHSMSMPFRQQDPLKIRPSLLRLPAGAFEKSESAETADEITEEQLTGQSDDPAQIELAAGNQLQIEVGNLVHEALQNYLSNNRLLDTANVAGLKRYWRRRLSAFSFASGEIDNAMAKIEQSLHRTLQDPELRWVFDHEQEQSAAELPLQSYANGFVHTHIIDRTFIDDNGVRWIIDYKSSQPSSNQSLESFLAEQIALYSGQLSRYKNLFASEENKGIKTALLFTSLPKLIECE
ncbi:MAG: UvrD-helicase domain-containing protein [Gammaproteobacteria bacterium]|nr:UvrD-helicase domain-containing protein [Gammaproteobacteria bacterium]